MRSWWILLAALGSAGSGAQAGASAWAIEEIDNGCMASKSFYAGPNPTLLALARSVDGRFSMILKNSGWSTEPGKEYDIYLLIDKNFYEGRATGEEDGSLLFMLGADVLKSITNGEYMTSALKVDDNNEKILEQIKLVGSSAAMGRVKACVAGVATANQRRDKIPPDPFAR